MLKTYTGGMLVNVLVSLGIILMMATVSMPYLRSFRQNVELSETAREIVSDLRYAQQLTITEQVPHGVYFNDAIDSYYVFKLIIPTSTIKAVSLPANISFDTISGFTSNLVNFNSYGSVDQDGEIILSNTNNASSTITVKPSGYVQISN
ncbi:hypothetical protein KAJ89_00080 [Candidatus Parcubacteria bacterium]|nr:hypothetical protein [Candidatus Parcubacteria bacterium]